MKRSKQYEEQKNYWEQAGEIGYGKAMYSGAEVERHIVSMHWQALLEMASVIGLGPQSRILELGCGDGEFAEQALSPRFRQVDAFDFSAAAIERARSRSRSGNVYYHVADLTTHEYAPDGQWDGAILKGFLHHVKDHVGAIIPRLARVCPRVVVMEPNGDNLIRKLLELTPAYSRAGEDSFRLMDLVRIFRESGYEIRTMRRMTVVPPFLPAFLLPVMKRIESIVEHTRGLDRLCSSYCLGFALQRKR